MENRYMVGYIVRTNPADIAYVRKFDHYANAYRDALRVSKNNGIPVNIFLKDAPHPAKQTLIETVNYYVD